MGKKNNIARAVIERLPRYYRVLKELIDEGVIRISSKQLSERLNFTASQVRQDLNNFGGFGQQGYGYSTKDLYKNIANIMGISRKQKMIIIGAGTLGKAIASYNYFHGDSFELVAIFDVDEKIVSSKVSDICVRHINYLPEIIKAESIDIAILAVHKDQAEEMALIVTSLGINKIWNFADTDLEVDKKIIVENVNLTDSLMRLSLRAELER